METRKPQIVACFIGHVDSGKSTTVGHLSVLFGTTDQRKMEKLKCEAEKRNKGSFSYAYVCDTLGAERDRGITIKTNLIKLEMPDRTVNVMDCPGHKDFIKNMVTGAAQADVAIVIVPCARGEFESAISGGTLKEHVLIAGVFGVRKLVIAVNKVDTVPEAEQEKRFNEVITEMKNIVKSCHPEKNPICVPISGMQGTNLSNANPDRFSWWKGVAVPKEVFPRNIVTLQDAIEATPLPTRPVEAPTRAVITSRIPVAGHGSVYTGQVISGRLAVGDALKAFPSMIDAEVKSLEIHRSAVQEVLPGENFGSVLRVPAGQDKPLWKGGNVLCNKAQQMIDHGYAYLAEMVNIAHNRITTKYAPTMGVYTNSGPVQCVKFLSSQSLKNKEVKHDNPEVIQKNFKFVSILKPLGTQKFIAEPYTITPQLGRCCLRDGGKIVAIGQIKKILSKAEYAAYGLPLDDDKNTPAAKVASGKKK